MAVSPSTAVAGALSLAMLGTAYAQQSQYSHPLNTFDLPFYINISNQQYSPDIASNTKVHIDTICHMHTLHTNSLGKTTTVEYLDSVLVVSQAKTSGKNAKTMYQIDDYRPFEFFAADKKGLPKFTFYITEGDVRKVDGVDMQIAYFKAAIPGSIQEDEHNSGHLLRKIGFHLREQAIADPKRQCQRAPAIIKQEADL